MIVLASYWGWFFVATFALMSWGIFCQLSSMKALSEGRRQFTGVFLAAVSITGAGICFLLGAVGLGLMLFNQLQ
jgi:hypothetical protein